MLLLAIAGALLNIALDTLCIKLGIPLYLDTVFTVAVTLGGGVFWGVLTGTLTNLIGHSIRFWGWEGYLFTLCNIATALVTFLFVRLFPAELSLTPHTLREESGQENSSAHAAKTFPNSSSSGRRIMDRIMVLIFLSASLCIAISVLGGLISEFINFLRNPAGTGPASTALGSAIFNQNFPPILVEILSRIPINIVDRLITAFGGYGIAYAIVLKPFAKSPKSIQA